VCLVGVETRHGYKCDSEVGVRRTQSGAPLSSQWSSYRLNLNSEGEDTPLRRICGTGRMSCVAISVASSYGTIWVVGRIADAMRAGRKNMV
jgi:hypothetical protein